GGCARCGGGSRRGGGSRGRGGQLGEVGAGGGLGGGGEGGEDALELDGFDEVVVEAGAQRALAVFGLAVAGEGDQAHLQAGELAGALGDLVAVHDGQADVEQDDVGLELADGAQGAGAVVLDADVVADGGEGFG